MVPVYHQTTPFNLLFKAIKFHLITDENVRLCIIITHQLNTTKYIVEKYYKY